MTEKRSTEELVARLADEIEPVRRTPPMRGQLALVASVWCATAILAALSGGIHLPEPRGVGRLSAGVAVALSLAGFAGVTLGLAARTPGRERLARGAAVAIALGAAIVVGLAIVAAGPSGGAVILTECVRCAGRSILLATPPGAMAIRLALRGAGWRPWIAGLAVATGAASLGGLLVHLTCPSPSIRHWLVAHVFLPAIAGIALGLVAAAVLLRVARHADAAQSRRFGA